MLQKSDFDVPAALELLGKYDIDATFLVPTPTGLKKSILDATGSVRDYLLDAGYHDFLSQPQGGEHKVQREVFFVRAGSLERSMISMYRPPTKSGDPRTWLGAATKRNVAAFNLLALTVQQGVLYILNMSDPTVRSSLDNPSSPFRGIVDANRPTAGAADELLDLLRGVCARGFVTTLRPGDTGVGMTLETLLGIAANSRRTPDFKGIEIKAKRHRTSGKSVNRSTLFSKVPSWKLSPAASAMGLLQRRGYVEEGRLQLYQTVSSSANRRGLKLDIDGERDWLKQVHVDDETSQEVHDVTWELKKLRDDLAAKHQETFWVQAQCRGSGANEQFQYVAVNHTRAPLVRNFSALVEAGVITLDYLLHQQGNRARDHGYLFKIHPRNLRALFPEPVVHVLA